MTVAKATKNGHPALATIALSNDDWSPTAPHKPADVDVVDADDDGVDHGAGRFVNGEFIKENGLNWFVTGLFVVGDLAGGGIVALPTAAIQLGFYPGLIVCVIMNVMMLCTAYFLGSSWNVLLRRWPVYRRHCRKPYPEMAYRAFGRTGQIIVSVIIDITQFGISVVFLLLSAKNIHDLIRSWFDYEFSFCYVIIIVAIGVLPVLFLKSPADFWGVVVCAMLSTTTAVIIITAGALIDYGTCHPYSELPNFKITNYFLGIGTLLFSYGGHSAFPTIQHDMKRPKEFTKSAFLAYAILFLMYMPVIVMGFLSYGDSLRSSVINSIQTQWMQEAVNILITAHCILTITIISNPLSQEVEDIFKIPHEFGIKRVFIRTGILIAIAFVALSVPTFGPLLDLMGGTTLGLTSTVLPALFYVFLTAAEEKAREQKAINDNFSNEEDVPISWREVIQRTDKKILCIVFTICVIGILGGAAATYSAIVELSTTQFSYPCYVLPFINKTSSNSDHSTNCCGRNQTIKVFDDIKCSAPDLLFYH